ncbi:MAG: lipoprotein NlpI [Aeromonas sp.]
MKNYCGIKSLLAAALLASTFGCTSQSQPLAAGNSPLLPAAAAEATQAQIVLATPLQVAYQSELALARLGQMLSEIELTPSQRAELFYERGIIFDRVGLRSLGRLDFNRALREKPDYADAHNVIGLHLLAAQNFDEAYEAFDAALELAPENEFAYLNRGAALYYGQRAPLAAADFKVFFIAQPRDPYRSLWRYFAEREVDAAQALTTLQASVKKYDDEAWNWQLARLFSGEISAKALMPAVVSGVKDNRELAERLCETYFYLGKFAQFNGDTNGAISYFKLALSNNVYDFLEHSFALIELDRLQNPLPPKG